MLEQLKQDVCYANLDLVARGVVIYTWGNVSGISDDRKYMVIKPSGVDYDGMSAEDMVVVDIESGETVEGKWKPSSDTKTHLALYKKYSQIKGIVHTHSTNAVACTGWHENSSAWYNSCGLFLRRYSMHERAEQRRSNGSLRTEYRQGHYRDNREDEL